MTIALGEKEFNRLQTFTQIVSVVTEQIQSRVVNNVDYELLCRERDNFRIPVAITNAVLSPPGYGRTGQRSRQRNPLLFRH